MVLDAGRYSVYPPGRGHATLNSERVSPRAFPFSARCPHISGPLALCLFALLSAPACGLRLARLEPLACITGSRRLRRRAGSMERRVAEDTRLRLRPHAAGAAPTLPRRRSAGRGRRSPSCDRDGAGARRKWCALSPGAGKYVYVRLAIAVPFRSYPGSALAPDASASVSARTASAPLSSASVSHSASPSDATPALLHAHPHVHPHGVVPRARHPSIGRPRFALPPPSGSQGTVRKCVDGRLRRSGVVAPATTTVGPPGRCGSPCSTWRHGCMEA